MKKMGFIEKILAGKDVEKAFFRVISVNQDVLSKYHNSLGWMLTCLVDQGKLPSGAFYVGTGKTEKEVIAYFYKPEQTVESVKDFLADQGVEVEQE